MSSLNPPSFARALSPQMEMLTQAVIANTLSTNKPNEALDSDLLALDEYLRSINTKISNARSMPDLVEAVYPDYRVAFQELILTFAAWVDTRETVRTAFSRFENAVAIGDVPQRLKVKVPEFQLTQDFREVGSEASLKALKGLSDAQAASQAAFSRAAVDAKKAELKFWVDKTSVEQASELTRDASDKVWKSRESQFFIPSFEKDANGNLRLGAMKISPQKQMEHVVMTALGPLLHNQIDHIVASRHKAMLKKIDKKREVAHRADVEMADATKPGPSLQSLVDKAVHSKIKALRIDAGKKESTSGRSTSSKAAPAKPSTSKKTAAPSKSKDKPNAVKTAKKVADKKAVPRERAKRQVPDRKGKGRA